MKWIAVAIAPLVLVIPLSGCGSAEEGDGIDRQAVEGTVNLASKPLASGSIQFVPAGDPNAPGGASGQIRDGRYEIPSGRGPAPGRYKVMISSHQDPGVNPDEAPGPPPKKKADPIPKKYNTATKLEAEVKTGQANVFDYELDAK